MNQLGWCNYNEPSLIDLLHTDQSLKPTKVTLSPPLGKSDHVLKSNFCIKVENPVKQRLNWNKGNYAMMQRKTRERNKFNFEGDVNEAWLRFKH